MRLLEYQAKEIFSEYGIKTPLGFVSNNIQEGIKQATQLKLPVIIKAQVPIGGRGKSGAIQKCNDIDEFMLKYDQILNMKVKNEKTRSVLTEKLIPYEKELYLSIFLNRSKRCYNIIASLQGGIEIESFKNQIIHEMEFDSFNNDLALQVADGIKLVEKQQDNFVLILKKLFRLVIDKEAELAEINPLVILKDNNLLALDGKIITDDNANFRHPELQKFNQKTTIERKAEENGFSLVELDGDIAVIGNGAGLVMSTLDILTDHGGKAACFLDVGGGATIDSVYEALKIISKIKNVKGILINLYGGIVKTTTVAHALIKAYNNKLINVRVSARLKGTESQKSKELLATININMFDSVEDAINFITSEIKKC
ncbi:MAG: acetate--CoA ligase family protein [Nitrosopumilaceae archaeon]|nr:acetate--CoA ligase family protein [Nitrosopumilaceae archaeon]